MTTEWFQKRRVSQKSRKMLRTARNCHVTGSGLTWGFVMASQIAVWLMKKVVPWYSHDEWVSIYVTENNITDDGFF